ncbi:CDP-glycerol glycerophosphotransferase family protein [Xenorhabdus innexi]|uniref:Putative CDP-glycerol:poly(Glycerophosphate) glycerophosphotransferase n=1 Tax=Xenorhabdus innexi TaxID=290109 RepID=A0A1N6MRS7_9GAMM|nr:CDP-glycerol glycerophosphotransferase family protein [Xenorhabdus innexi]PHM38548.1 putative teichoic acid biosynthesis protein [Xenorhabdus innexi]SIP71546.1 putative CDP-glycerol:poly(Glycerophosphate) glycerophosphotransferase [Xenorhabdus innexi]
MNLNKLKKGLILLISYPIYPISFLFPSSKKKWLFGSFGEFNDNSRYLFEYCVKNEKKLNCYWLAKNRSEFSLVKEMGYPVIYKYSLLGLFHLLTSKVYIYSSYVNNLSYFTSGKKTLVNLWHGIPLKKIEFDIATPPLNSYFKDANLCMKILYPHYHKRENLLLCPGEYLYKNIFYSAFRKSKNKIIDANYPRVSFLKDKKNNSKNKVFTITYTPTWRDDNPHFINDKIDLLHEIDKLAELKKFQFNLKLHSNSKFNPKTFKNFKNITIIDNKIDPMDLLLSTDCLITDYSSIYLDFLVLDRPIVFFQYDKNHYLKNRELYEYKINVLPGYVCLSDIDLINVLSSKICKTTHKKERADLLELISSKNDNSYIINKIKDSIS